MAASKRSRLTGFLNHPVAPEASARGRGIDELSAETMKIGKSAHSAFFRILAILSVPLMTGICRSHCTMQKPRADRASMP